MTQGIEYQLTRIADALEGKRHEEDLAAEARRLAENYYRQANPVSAAAAAAAADRDGSTCILTEAQYMAITAERDHLREERARLRLQNVRHQDTLARCKKLTDPWQNERSARKRIEELGQILMGVSDFRNDKPKGESLGERLRALRLDREWKLREVAERSGVSESYLSQLEREERNDPSARVLQRLARFYCCTIEELLGDDTPATPTQPAKETL